MANTVSVVLSTFMRANVLRRTVSSYLQPPVMELIVVDDGSPVSAMTAIDGLQKDSVAVKGIRMESNQGQPVARNLGAEHASGEFILFGEDDILLAPDCVSVLVETFLAEEAAGQKVGCLIPRLATLDHYRSLSRNGALCVISPYTGDLFFNFEKESPIPVKVPYGHACMLVRRSTWEEIGPFDTGYLGRPWRIETEYQFRLRKHGYSLFYQPSAHATHLNSEGGIRGKKFRFTENEFYFIYNHSRFLMKCFGASALPMSLTYTCKRVMKTGLENRYAKPTAPLVCRLGKVY